MFDTRLKVDGKWNFKMENVWFMFVMLMCTVWIALEAFVSYLTFTLTGELHIGIMVFINIIFMMMAVQRRVIDKTIARVKALEDWE